MTTYFTPAKTAAEFSESLLLTSTPSTLSASSSVGSVSDVEGMMLDDDFDEPCLSACTLFTACQRQSYAIENERVQLDLVSGDPAAVTSAVHCFIKNFVW